MLRLSSAICPFCEARAIFKTLPPSWQTSRSAATLQKRRPSRMTLSPNVRRGPPPPGADNKNVRKSRNSPFGGMNVTATPRRLEYEKVNRASPAEQKRISRFSKSEGKTERDGAKSRRDPMKALKMQRALANVPYEKRTKVKTRLMDQGERFEEFDLLPVVKESIPTEALAGLVDLSPTPVQRLAIPALLETGERRKGKRTSKKQEGDTGIVKPEMQQYLLAAETGSGKTLAYVLPVIDAIKRAEMAEAAEQAEEDARNKALESRERARPSKLFEIEPPSDNTPDPSTARPRAIILVPTSELVDQIGSVVKSLSHRVKFRSALLSSTYTGRVIRSRLFTTGGIDVVISTPHLLSSITEADPNILSRLTHLVVDEADSLLDRSFAPTTSSIIDRAAPSLKQLILCSATIPRSLDNYLRKRFPEIRRLATPNLHAIPRRVQLSVVDIDKLPYQGNRDLACAQIIWDLGKEGADGDDVHEMRKGKKIVVFVNEREKSEDVAKYLRSKGIEAQALSRDSEGRKEAGELLASFTGPPTASSSSSKTSLVSQMQSSAAKPSRNTTVLVMTDLGSRGIDTRLASHVILYDVPHTSIDFIHRLGRVGRMNRRGRGVVLVGKGDRRDVVREVKDGMFRGAALI